MILFILNFLRSIDKHHYYLDYSDDVEDCVSYMEKCRERQRVISIAQSILVVGGGAVGAELAGETLPFSSS